MTGFGVECHTLSDSSYTHHIYQPHAVPGSKWVGTGYKAGWHGGVVSTICLISSTRN